MNSFFLVYPLAFIPRSSSAPNREAMHFNEYQQYHVENNYPQYLLRSPSHGNNFIMQSNHSTTTPRNQFYQEFYQPSVTSRSSPQPPAPPPPPPPPLPADLFTSRSSPWSTMKIPISSRSKRSNRSQPVDEFQQELTQRLTGRIVTINQNSSKDEVQRWLATKNISSQLAQNLKGMNGNDLFQLSKNTLDQLTNPEESARVFSLLSQQKKLSGYQLIDATERSPVLNNSALSSLKSSTINDADDNFSFRLDDTLTRSLKIKLKQQRDKIEQAQTHEQIVL